MWLINVLIGAPQVTTDEKTAKAALKDEKIELPSKEAIPSSNRLTFTIGQNGRFLTNFDSENKTDNDAAILSSFLYQLNEGAYTREILQNMLLTKDPFYHVVIANWTKIIQENKPVIECDAVATFNRNVQGQ